MAYFDTPAPSEPRVSPQFLMGAASPLWSYFGAAAAGGVAFWWMTRWTQPVNLEAFFGSRTRLLPALEPMVEVVETVTEAIVETIEAAADATVEAFEELPPPAVLDTTPEIDAPTSLAVPEPIVEGAPEPVLDPTPAAAPDPIPDPVLEAAPAPEPAAPPAVEAIVEPVPKFKPKKAAPPASADEA